MRADNFRWKSAQRPVIERTTLAKDDGVRIAVLIKQVPRFESMTLGADGRLVREGLELEINPYCRRAVSKGVELAREMGGTCTVVTLGPPAAEQAVLEAVAWGANEGIVISDDAFAGSDTLATARALARVLGREGPWDLILAGRNSVDADTGQVGPEVAELLDLPFLAGVRTVEVVGSVVRAHMEHDDGWSDAEVTLPALLSCAERLCEPAKVDSTEWAHVPNELIRWVGAAELGEGPWGLEGSRTRVGQIRQLEITRERVVLSGRIEAQVAEAVACLRDAGALGYAAEAPVHGQPFEAVADGWIRGTAIVAVLIEPDRGRVARELLGAAAGLAAGIGGMVVAVVQSGAVDLDLVGGWGADEVLVMMGGGVEEDVARTASRWCERQRPWAVLAPGTMWGREVASRLAARMGAGLTGDAVDITVENGRMVGWKPAFGGRLVAAITATSPIQLATVRPGMLPMRTPRPERTVAVTEMGIYEAGRIRPFARGREDNLDDLVAADIVIGVGAGVNPDEYPELEPLQAALSAELAATRKVTDRGWQPRSRQVGITGRSISPRLYIAIGLAGKFNHMVGVRGAGKILAINHDRDAPIFGHADLGIVADWRSIMPVIVAALEPSAAN